MPTIHQMGAPFTLAVLFLVLPMDAEEPTIAQEPVAAEEPMAAEEPQPVDPKEDQVDPCHPDGESGAWIDIVQRGIFRSVCASARWFDGFFGDARFDQEAERAWGRLSIDAIHDEAEGLEGKVRFKAEVEFPNLDRRVNAFMGREEEEDFISGRNEGVEALPELFRDDVDRDWLVGLGYRPVRGQGTSNRIDLRVGVRVRFPLEPFVQGRLRRHWFLSETRLLRFRNTVFWRNQKGFGNTVSLDFEQVLARPVLFRWNGAATFSESTEGVDWTTSATLYHSLGGLEALSHTFFVEGETDAEVAIERFGVRSIYRRQMFRRWFFGQLIGGVNFPQAPGEDRETSWELGVGFEIRYGSSEKGR